MTILDDRWYLHRLALSHDVNRIDNRMWVPVLVICAIALAIVWAPFQPAFRDELFGWLPDWVRQPFGFEDPGRYSSEALVTTAILFVAVNGIIGPTVEELYFRGHLLPRIDRFGAWVPVINSGLFSVYHFWSPWQLPIRVLQTLPHLRRWADAQHLPGDRGALPPEHDRCHRRRPPACSRGT